MARKPLINRFANKPENKLSPSFENPQEEVIEKDLIVITEEDVKKWREILEKYKAGKKNLETKIIDNEQFWKLRHWDTVPTGGKNPPASAWLWNCIVSKHADAHDAYPEPNILPHEETDKQEATTLSSIIPVILDINEFAETYDNVQWSKIKQGTGIYGVFWDPKKLNGLGDISVTEIDPLNIYWEPGINDIQKSRYVFVTNLVDNDILKMRYPQLQGYSGDPAETVKKYIYDDFVDQSDKSIVVDVYYHTERNGVVKLHYAQFVGNKLLFASENKSAFAEKGWYEHGQYPFVFDTLFKIQGSPFGYGYTDIAKRTQLQIDALNDGVMKLAQMASIPRFFINSTGAVNEAEFADWTNNFVHVSGSNLGDDSIREIKISSIDGAVITTLNNKIEELKETTGNRDVNNGGTTSGATAASAMAIMQEQGGKLMRDANKTTYSAYKKLVKLTIELVRQFYDIKRQFRITGANGEEQFIDYSNANLKASKVNGIFGVGSGERVPEFDIEVSAQKETMYTKIAQNELALQMYNAGFFNPELSDQALACLDQMDFKHKEMVVQKIQRNSQLMNMLQTYQQLAIGLAAKYEPEMARQLMNSLPGATATPYAQGVSGIVETNELGELKGKEHPFVERARAEAQGSSQPN